MNAINATRAACTNQQPTVCQPPDTCSMASCCAGVPLGHHWWNTLPLVVSPHARSIVSEKPLAAVNTVTSGMFRVMRS